jgi:hypothetical protein
VIGETVLIVVGRDDGRLWIVAAGFAVVLLLLMGLMLLVINRLRRRGSATFARSPLWEVGYRERTQIVKAIRRNRPVAPHQRDIALRTAAQIVRRGRWPIWAIGAVGVGEAVLAAFNSGLGRITELALAVLLLCLAGYSGWLTRRARIYERQWG